MQRLTVQSLISLGIPTKVQLCEDDPRFYSMINLFQERALDYGRWWGTTQLAQFCIQPNCGQACIVLPREVAVIEAATMSGVPVNVQNMWGQFVRPHVPSECGCGSSNGSACDGNVGVGRCRCGCACGPVQMQDEGMVASYNVTATGDKIRFFASNAADIGKSIIVQGYSAAGVWVRTNIDGIVQDGERVTFQSVFPLAATTVNTWAAGSPTGIIKEETKYRVLAFAVDADDNERQIGDYQANETHPTYIKKRIVNSWARGACGDPNQTLRAIVSLQHVPVSQPNDALLFTSASAYRFGVQAELFYDNNDTVQGDAMFYGRDDVPRNGRGVLRSVKLSGALPTLQNELRKMTGDVSSVSVKRDGVSLVGFV